MLLVTGGAGFIGSNFVVSNLAATGEAIVNLDKLTYAGDLKNLATIAGDARYVFVSDDKGAVHALDRIGGSSLWKLDKLRLRNLSAPLALGREIVVADIQGYVHFLARDSGAFVGRVATDGSPVSTNPLMLPNGGCLIQTRNGGLYAFNVK